MDNLVDAHLVGGQSTGLVRADDTAASEGLDRGQASDHSVLSGHLPGSEGKAGGDDNGKTFGNSGDTEGHSDLEIVDGALGPATVAGVVEVGDVDEPDQDADDSNDLGQAVTEVVELLLQGSGLRDLGSDALMDVADGSAGSGQNNSGPGATSDDSSSRKQNIDLILKNGLFVVNHSGGILADTLALSSKDGLVDGEAVALNGNDSAVGGDSIADSDGNNVAGDQLLSLDSRNMSSIANDVGLVGRVFLQGCDSLFSAALLGDSDDTIENENCEDLLRVSESVLGSAQLRGGFVVEKTHNCRVDECAPALFIVKKGQDKGNGGGAKKDNDKLILKLFENKLPEGSRGLFRDS